MGAVFAQTLKTLRGGASLSQQQLAEQLFVDRSTIARWETGSRVPDNTLLARLALCLNTDVSVLCEALQADETPKVIVVDDERIALAGAVPVVEQALPSASVVGFIRPSDALDYAKNHSIALAFVDVEMGATSGFDLARELLAARPQTNVVFLTAHREYSFDAWATGASGFLLKPVTVADVRAQLSRLLHPKAALGASPAQDPPRMSGQA